MFKIRTVLLVILSVSYVSNAYCQEQDGKWLAENFYKQLLENDVGLLSAAFSGEPAIDTPRTGEISGADDFSAFLQDELAWLESRGLVMSSLTPIKMTVSNERAVFEQSMVLENTPGPSKKHNFAVVVDLDPTGGAEAVRLYYGLNAITGGHEFSRPAMLEHNPALFDGLAPPVKQYLASIGNAYRDVYRMFTENGCFGPFCGKNRAKFFVIAMHNGPVPIEVVTSTCDSISCAVEENLASWGESFSINTGGLAVFEFTETGQVSVARVYDDIHDVSFLETGWFAENWDDLSEGFMAVGCPMTEAPGANDPFMMALGKIMMQPCSGD